MRNSACAMRTYWRRIASYVDRSQVACCSQRTIVKHLRRLASNWAGRRWQRWQPLPRQIRSSPGTARALLRRVMAPSPANLLAVPALTRRLKMWWCGWPARIAPGAMTALSVLWPTWATRSVTRPVGNILKRHEILAAPERKRTTTWKEFIRTHMAVLVATNFFTAEMGTWCGLVIAAVLCCLPFGSRKIQGAGMTAYCTAWLMTWHTNAERWIGFAVAQGLAGLLQCCHRLPRLSPAVCAPHEYHVCLPQDSRKGVPLPVVAYRPIRDGPRRRRPRLGGRPQDGAREAA